MEIAFATLEGEARLLDVPIDSLKDFVSQFNSAILSSFPLLPSPLFDLTNTQRVGTTLRLQWRFDDTGRPMQGCAEYDLETQELRLTRQEEA